MPSSETRLLRIYCVCGQKMKVSEDMFGRPGKCIACRQKIRIPRLDELSDNSTTLYLKDHPEFLRKVKKRPVDKKAAKSEVRPEIELPERNSARGSVAMDVLEVQRALWSLDAKAKVFQQAGESGVEFEGPKATELRKFRTRIKTAFEDLEEELRQRLMETAIELTTAQESISQLNLAVRVAEVTFDDYTLQIDRLRRRRDAMERRQINLRGWLAANSVASAGGYIDAEFNQIPGGSIRVTFASDVEDAPTLLDWHVEGLRRALLKRARAERAWREAERTTLVPGSRNRDERLADFEAEKERADSEAQFFRDRLEQLGRDYANDVQSIEAQLDHARNRLRIGAIERDQFASIERDLIRSKTDYAKARRLVTRALTANSSEEVPHPRGTFMERLAQGGQGMRVPPDAWLAWGAAALVVVSLFLPITGNQSPLNLVMALHAHDPDAHWLMSFPIGLALLLGLSALTRQATPRGLFTCALWIVGSVVTVAYFHEAGYLDSDVGDQLRKGAPYVLRPGVIAFALGLVLTGASAFVALAGLREVRAVVPLAGFLILAASGLIISDIGGIRTAQPHAVNSPPIMSPSGPREYRTTVTVSNSGRRLMLLQRNPSMINAYDYLLEKRVGTTSWNDAGPADTMRTAGHTNTLTRTTDWKIIPLSPESTVDFTYRLAPGEYRVQFGSAQRGWTVAHTFTLDPFPPGTETTADTAPPVEPKPNDDTAAAGESAGTVPTELSDLLKASVVLAGIVAQPGKPAQFSLKVTMADGRSSVRLYSVGDEVHSGWIVSEFNPKEQTVTLMQGGQLLILRRGESYDLKPQA